jgi:hypothetical protein
VTQHPSRKQFVAKLLGVVAASSVVTKLFAKSENPTVAGGAATAAPASRSLEVRRDARAIARRDDAV